MSLEFRGIGKVGMKICLLNRARIFRQGTLRRETVRR